MRRSPTRPLILKRRKLPFHQNATDSQPGESGSKEPSKPAAAEVQSVIGALTAKDNECGAQGPNKFILLSGSGSDKKWDCGPDSQSAAEGAATRSTEGHKVKAETTHSFAVNKDVNCGPFDDSLTDLHWLGKMSTCDLEPNSTKQLSSKENQNPLQTFQNKFILLSGSASVNKWDYGSIPETAEVQSVIGALTAKDNECGAQGPNKLILLSGSGSGNKWDCGPDSQSPAEGAATRSTEGHKVKAETTGSFSDDSLGKMSTCDLEPNSTKQLSSKENQNPLQTFQAHNTHTSADAPQQLISERPPYSYMAMIQFAINSRKNRRMTLKEIYMWIEDNFPYYRDVAKPGWKNSIRHNLSLHDLFIRETSPDGKLSFWTIRHEANRYLTLDHVYKHQKRTLPDARKTPTSSAPCHPFCLSAIHFLLPAEWEQFTSSKESPHSTEGDTK
ncbi:unnamed protein product [Oreochromis niloticus]|nr:unnamed protein product [Mustela putorius furo]